MKIIGILGEIFRGKSFYVADSGGVRNIRVLEFPGFQILMCEIGGGVKNGQGERIKFALDKSQRTCYAFKCSLRVVTSFL